MKIEKPAEPVSDAIEEPSFLEILDVIRKAAEDAEDWAQRAQFMLDALDTLDEAFLADQSEDEEAFNEDEDFVLDVLPIIVAGVLERLDESEIHCVEQAAIYLLSLQLEHQAAADGWLAADDARLDAFVNFTQNNPYYGELMNYAAALTAANDEDPM